MQQRVADPVTVGEAAAILRGGGICAFATETVYGLGADAADADAVLAVYKAKARPRFNPLIVHCADFAMAERLVEFSPLARRLAVLWPGPLTLVLKAKPGDHVCDIAAAGLDTLAVRVPRHPQARALIEAVGRPLVAPSANPSGRLSPTTADHVRDAFEGRVPVLDGGPCAAGLESTILAVLDDGDGRAVQLRAGALPRAGITARTGVPVALPDADAPATAPGMLKSHYAPRARLRLNAEAPREGEAFLDFGAGDGGAGDARLDLSPSGDLREAARNLFSHLAALDAAGPKTIAVAPIPDTGLGEAINDRLRRAAAR